MNNNTIFVLIMIAIIIIAYVSINAYDFMKRRSIKSDDKIKKDRSDSVTDTDSHISSSITYDTVSNKTNIGSTYCELDSSL